MEDPKKKRTVDKNMCPTGTQNPTTQPSLTLRSSGCLDCPVDWHQRPRSTVGRHRILTDMIPSEVKIGMTWAVLAGTHLYMYGLQWCGRACGNISVSHSTTFPFTKTYGNYYWTYNVLQTCNHFTSIGLFHYPGTLSSLCGITRSRSMLRFIDYKRIRELQMINFCVHVTYVTT